TSKSLSTRWCCAPRRRPNMPPRTTGISVSTCAATPISPRRSAVMPTSSFIAASSAPCGSVMADCRRSKTPPHSARSAPTSTPPASRPAMNADRETSARLLAHFPADRIGATFEGHISGATRAGLFVKLDDTGADGFVPARTIGADYFRYHEDRHALIGAKSGETHRLGDRVTVRLVEAAPVAGALRFELLSEGRYNDARRRGTRERAAHAQSANRAQRERMRKR